ncbi:MAG: triose-phosphate isomerase [Deltaproteobacteria bacterium RIFCSPLOWO2_12_FULL_60_19]|nr:MAG: triose-phosphate isomerase [Deltaproteobacteria bacterium RIFCSPLOWO2_12_FULL_60_19]
MKPALVVGNWKMHGTRSEAVKLATGVLEASRRNLSVEVVLAPPFTALAAVSAALRCGAVRLAAQNLHWETEGAFTGEISVSMLRDLDCRYVIVGHSERRRLFGESDAIVAKKVGAALSAGLRPILCVGETLGERRRGRTNGVIARQLRVALKGLSKSAIEKLTFAYEPVWAIGTGKNATPEQIAAVHRFVRELLRRRAGLSARACRILYGGSVRPDNAAELAAQPEVDGVLVGGASLKVGAFASIVRSFGATAV